MFLSNKQMRMIELLDEQLISCRKCEFDCKNKIKPYWTPMSEFIIIHNPVYKDLEQNEHFYGKAFDILKYTLLEHNFRIEQFLIINSVNFITKNLHDVNNSLCFDLTLKYIKIIKPRHIFCFGNSSLEALFKGRYANISRYYNIILQYDYLVNNYTRMANVYSCADPASMFYNEDKFISILNRTIGLFSGRIY